MLGGLHTKTSMSLHVRGSMSHPPIHSLITLKRLLGIKGECSENRYKRFLHPK